MRSFRAPRCPECERPMEKTGWAADGRMVFWTCWHGKRVQRYPRSKLPVVGRVVRGRAYWARTVDGFLTERGFDDYGKGVHEIRAIRPSRFNVRQPGPYAVDLLRTPGSSS